MNDLRCAHCGRLLAKEDNGVIDIKTLIKQKILVTKDAIMFYCPWVYFNHEGRKQCGGKTKIEFSSIQGALNV